MGGMGAEAVPEIGEYLVCKSSFKWLMELAKTPSAKRQDQTLHKTQGV